MDNVCLSEWHGGVCFANLGEAVVSVSTGGDIIGCELCSHGDVCSKRPVWGYGDGDGGDPGGPSNRLTNGGCVELECCCNDCTQGETPGSTVNWWWCVVSRRIVYAYFCFVKISAHAGNNRELSSGVDIVLDCWVEDINIRVAQMARAIITVGGNSLWARSEV